MIDLIQKKSFDFFVYEANPKNGLIPDRAHNFTKGSTKTPATIAGVGFALTAYPVGVERGWMDYSEAYERTRRTLRFFLTQAPHEKGFFYHFMDMQTGARSRNSELSPIDTALFLAGVIFAAEYFDRPELTEMANQIYERVDFEWMLNRKKTLALGWSPETGFHRSHWDHYDEAMILYLLAIGSPTHPIPASAWKEISRPVGSYGGFRMIQQPPLFTHQYSHIWIDFRDKNDGYADYFQNSVNAARANRQFCIDQSQNFSTYGPDAWGLTASDGPFGYKAYGAPPGWSPQHDGTIAPTGCISSIVFTPEESIRCARHLYDNFKDKLWGMYGFSDAINVDKNWRSADVFAIDVGPMVLMIENYRSEFIWKTMMRNQFITKAMSDIGFKPGTKEIPWPDPPEYQVPYAAGGIQVDGYLKDWTNSEAIILDQTFRDAGYFENEKDLKGEIRFVWDETALYFSAKVTDQDIWVKANGRHIWRDDLLEIFIDPGGDGFFWKDERDYQIGVRPDEDGQTLTWSWFQNEDPAESGAVIARSFIHEEGYILEGKIKWRYLNLLPEGGLKIPLTAALHDIDRDRNEGKFLWFFRSEEELGRFNLGRIILTPAIAAAGGQSTD